MADRGARTSEVSRWQGGVSEGEFITGEGVVLNLKDTVAVVTGSGSGLGEAYARALASAGAAVVVNDVHSDAADDVASKIRSAGGTAVSAPGPVGETETAEALVATAVSEFGKLDTLVANAGVLRDGVLWKMTDEDFDLVVRVHLRGTFTCLRAAAIQMRAQRSGGSIVCVGSQTGQLGNFGQANYTAAKAGILGLVRTAAMELQRSEIAVNALIPFSASPMTETVPFLRDYVSSVEQGQDLSPFVRKAMGFGSPSDVAGLVVFLASQAGRAITGQAIGIGGDRLSLWTHPAETAVAFADGGGWQADQIAQAWSSTLGLHQQSLGLPTHEEPSA